MTMRTSHKTVTFTQPFSLNGIDEVQAAGTYTVETNEEPLQGVSFPAYRRIETLIFLPSRPGGPSWSALSTSTRWSCKRSRKEMPRSGWKVRGMRWPASPDHENNLSEEHGSGARPWSKVRSVR